MATVLFSLAQVDPAEITIIGHWLSAATSRERLRKLAWPSVVAARRDAIQNPVPGRPHQ